MNHKIGLGTVQFGVDYGISNANGITPHQELKEILTYAQMNSIKYLDSAHAYGSAENNLGKFDLSAFRIVSKYLPKEDLTIEQQFDLSRQRLSVDSLYAYMAHRPLDLLGNNLENWKLLTKLKANGLIKKIGCSFNTLSEVDRIIESDIELDIIQVPYNYWDNRFECYMKDLHNKGCEIHTRSTFLQGLYFCNENQLAGFFEPVKKSLRSLHQLENLPQRLLKYVIDKEFVDVCVIGVNNKLQLAENLKYNNTNSELSLPELDTVFTDEILTPSMWPNEK